MKIFRPDLKLNDKWGHRLVKVLWLFSIAAIIIGALRLLIYFMSTFDYVEGLKFRLKDDGYYTAKELLHSPREYISYQCDDYPIREHHLLTDDYDNLEGMFCSRNWSVQSLQEISIKTNLDYESYYNVDGKLGNLSVRQINDVIKYGNPELCIVKTNNGHDFLRFKGVYGDNLCIVKKYNAILLGVEFLGVIGLYIVVTILLYYKVIIYIIYGPEKNSNKKVKVIRKKLK